MKDSPGGYWQVHLFAGASTDRVCGSKSSADRDDNKTVGTSKCCCRTNYRTKQKPPAPDATSFDDGSSDCAGTTPSNCCNRPSGHSDTAPSPTVHNLPRSIRMEDTRSNCRNDRAPNCRSC